MIIPYKELNRDTLINLIKEYVLREGTDYGESEISLETKIEQILSQLNLGKLVITYSEEHESIDICPASKFPSSH